VNPKMGFTLDALVVTNSPESGWSTRRTDGHRRHKGRVCVGGWRKRGRDGGATLAIIGENAQIARQNEPVVASKTPKWAPTSNRHSTTNRIRPNSLKTNDRKKSNRGQNAH
jgi:hypothetical protein